MHHETDETTVLQETVLNESQQTHLPPASKKTKFEVIFTIFFEINLFFKGCKNLFSILIFYRFTWKKLNQRSKLHHLLFTVMRISFILQILHKKGSHFLIIFMKYINMIFVQYNVVD